MVYRACNQISFFILLIPIGSISLVLMQDKVNSNIAVVFFFFFVLLYFSVLILGYFRKYRLNYSLLSKSFKFNNSVYANRKENILYESIDKIEIKQDYLEKLIGLSSFWIYNKSTSVIMIPGMRNSDATKLKEIILTKTET